RELVQRAGKAAAGEVGGELEPADEAVPLAPVHEAAADEEGVGAGGRAALGEGGRLALGQVVRVHEHDEAGAPLLADAEEVVVDGADRKSTRLNSSHVKIS